MRPDLRASHIMNLAAAVLTLALALAADERVDRLPADHRTWLEEEAVYIITPRERDVFLSIEAREQRERFIDAFWKRRDPNPVTPRNEFREEHYRRLAHANEVLGRETPRPGFRTDRGKYYILLGEPREVQVFESAELVSSELWFYDGDRSLGLPSFFYLLFYRPDNTGEYRLYHPVVDGPGALLYGRPNWTDSMALGVIDDVSLELARASLSLDPSEPPDYRRAQASLGSDLLLARIDEAPARSVKTDYLDGWLRYGDRVSADYSFHFVPNRAVFAVLDGPDDTSFVHLSVEIDPADFSFETDEERTRYYTTVDVRIEARTLEGSLVVSKSREIFAELTPNEFDRAKSLPLAFQDVLPLVPGEFQLSAVLENRAERQFTVAETEILIEPRGSRPSIRDVVLGFGSEMSLDRKADEEVRPFQAGGFRIHATAERVFAIGETAIVLAQVTGAGPSHRLRLRLLDGEREILRREADVADAADGVVRLDLPLEGIEGGRFELRAELIGASGAVGPSRSVELVVSPRTALSRLGFVSRRGFDASVPGLLSLEKGEQHWKLGELERAREELRRSAATNNPDLPMARWGLASVSLQLGEVDRALEILLPIASAYPDRFEVVAGLGYGFRSKGSCESALPYLEKATTLRPPDASLLNALGDCYQRLGEVEKAMAAFRSSLELDSKQEETRARLRSLGERP